MPCTGDTRFPDSIPLERWTLISEVRETFRERRSGHDVLCRFQQYEQADPRPLG
jgi:hypothetical protein